MESSYPVLDSIHKFTNYQDLSLDNYYTYFTKSTENGGSISDIILYHKDLRTNNYLRRGGGFWSFLGNLAKKSLPFIKNIILPEALNIGQSLLETQQKKGKISKQDFSDISKDTVKRVVKKVITGSGKKKKIIKKTKTLNKTKNSKKKRKLQKKNNRRSNKKQKLKHFDIFTSI